MKKKIEDVAFPRILTTNKRLKQLKSEAKKLNISVKELAEQKFKALEK